MCVLLTRLEMADAEQISVPNPWIEYVISFCHLERRLHVNGCLESLKIKQGVCFDFAPSHL